MATQLLVYENAVPVSRQRHKDWSVKTGSDYSFARRVNSVPLMAAEFAVASSDYPIVFAGTKEEMIPAVLLGFRDQENLYVDEQGAWNAKYVPAFIRRYPFLFSSSDGGQNFTLCIDESFSGCNTEGRGERLFDSQGEQTQYVKTVLGFLQAYQLQFQRTQALCRKLRDLDLLEPMQAQVSLKVGQRITLGGFFTVNRDRLKNLSGDTLSELVKADELELVYIHLFSLANFTPMAERTRGSAPVNQSASKAEPATLQ
jgi:SapC